MKNPHEWRRIILQSENTWKYQHRQARDLVSLQKEEGVILQYSGNPEEGCGTLGFGCVEDSVLCVGGAGCRNHSRKSMVEFLSSCMKKELIYIGHVCIHWNWPGYLEFPRDCEAALAPPHLAQAGVSHFRETALHHRSARQT